MYAATVPIPGDHVIALSTPQHRCPSYAAADGFTRDPSEALIVQSAVRARTTQIRFEPLSQPCELAISGQLLGRDEAWARHR